MMDNPLVHTVGIWFESERIGGRLEAGDDLSEVGYFALPEVLPLAFPTDQIVLDMLCDEQTKVHPPLK